MKGFAEKKALVTGASSGIGRAIVLELARRGAEVHLVGRSRSTLEAVAEVARQSQSRAYCYEVDLARAEQVEELARQLGLALSHLDVLVHSAGVISLGRVEDVDGDELDYLLEVNLCAPYRLTRGLLPLIREGRGQIVFINSSVINSPRAALGPYAATKQALKAIADSLRAEVNAEGLRVISVFPGRTASPMQSWLHAAESKAYQPERLLQPESVAMTVVRSLQVPFDAEITDVSIRPFQKIEEPATIQQ